MSAAPQVTTILVMKTENLADIKTNLSRYVDEVERQHERITITRNGKPAAVLVSVEDLEGLEETLEVLRDPDLMGVIRESMAELTARHEPGLTYKDLWHLKESGAFGE